MLHNEFAVSEFKEAIIRQFPDSDVRECLQISESIS